MPRWQLLAAWLSERCIQLSNVHCSDAGAGESVEEVAARFLSLLSRLEEQHSGSTILLVAHGDTLSIGTAAVKNRADMRHHKHSFYLGTAEMLKLV